MIDILQVVRMMIILTVIFFLTWAPRSFYVFAANYGPYRVMSDSLRYRIDIYVSIISYVNSCINPLIYIISSR